MNPTIERTAKHRIEVADLVRQLMSHPLYEAIHDERTLRVFMRTHVFCVWDFQSLLKALQRSLTCINIPWLPTRDPEARRLINELVLEEESDKVGESYLSHFELYLQAMNDCGADRRPIDGFIASLSRGDSFEEALGMQPLPSGVESFVRTTLSIAQSEQVHRIAAAFTYGREDVIPVMFQPLADRLAQASENKWKLFLDYLKRHIEYDGERHGPLSKALLARICGDDGRLWDEAEETARASLQARLQLWGEIRREINQA